MKHDNLGRFRAFSVLLIVSVCLTAAGKAVRERILMDGGWRFHRGGLPGTGMAPQGPRVEHWRWITITKKLGDWQKAMTKVFLELRRVVRPAGFVAFEVCEVSGGKLKLEEAVLPCGVAVGLQPEFVLIHDQKFTKTSHLWGQQNNVKGTNTNRIVLFRRPQ